MQVSLIFLHCLQAAVAVQLSTLIRKKTNKQTNKQIKNQTFIRTYHSSSSVGAKSHRESTEPETDKIGFLHGLAHCGFPSRQQYFYTEQCTITSLFHNFEVLIVSHSQTQPVGS